MKTSPEIAAEIFAKAIAVFTLPLYTRHVSSDSYGTYNALLTAVILSSIVLRLGVGEAFVRFYFIDSDEQRKTRIARTAMATVAWTTTVATLVAVGFSSGSWLGNRYCGSNRRHWDRRSRRSAAPLGNS